MTVLLSQRKESKSKVISYAYNIKSMLIKLMQRGLGINLYEDLFNSKITIVNKKMIIERRSNVSN